MERTVLFADIVDSTGILHDHGEIEGRQLIMRCLDLMTSAVEATGGTAADTPDARPLASPSDGASAAPDRASLQALMWDKVGIVRDGPGLAQAVRQLAGWSAAQPAPHDRPSHELANMLLAGHMMAEAALLREESRGAHFRTDFPLPRDEWRRHITFRRAAGT